MRRTSYERVLVWRVTYAWDQEAAARARAELLRIGAYPKRDLVGDSAYDRQEQLQRETVHNILDAITDRNDLHALYTLARLLAVVPRAKGLWHEVSREDKARQRPMSLFVGEGKFKGLAGGS